MRRVRALGLDNTLREYNVDDSANLLNAESDSAHRLREFILIGVETV